MLQVERFIRQSRLLLRQSRTMLRHCCWCGRGLRLSTRRVHSTRPARSVSSSDLIWSGSVAVANRSTRHRSLVTSPLTSSSVSFALAIQQQQQQQRQSPRSVVSQWSAAGHAVVSDHGHAWWSYNSFTRRFCWQSTLHRSATVRSCDKLYSHTFILPLITKRNVRTTAYTAKSQIHNQ